MKHPAVPKPTVHGSLAFTILRIFLTLLPAPILLIGIAAATQLDALWLIAIIPIPFLVFATGYFDGKISLHQQQINPSTERKQLLRWAVLFSLLQIVIAPMFCGVILASFAVIENFWAA